MSTLKELQTIAAGTARGDGAAKGVLDLETFSDGMSDVIEKVVAPLLARISALESRGPGVEFRGVYDETDVYKRGDVVTDQSAVWFCCDDTSSRPGKSASWKLLLKAAGR